MSSWTHSCVVEYGFQVPGHQFERKTVLLVVKDVRYEDEWGYFYDRHLCPGRAIVSGTRYQRRLLLETLRELPEPRESRMVLGRRERVRLDEPRKRNRL